MFALWRDVLAVDGVSLYGRWVALGAGAQFRDARVGSLIGRLRSVCARLSGGWPPVGWSCAFFSRPIPLPYGWPSADVVADMVGRAAGRAGPRCPRLLVRADLTFCCLFV